MTQALVLDASVMVTLLTRRSAGTVISRWLHGVAVHVPAHFDAEILSALGRLHRAGGLASSDIQRGLSALSEAPFQRHALAPLLASAWTRRDNVRLVDALYVALADELKAPLLTLDRGLASASAHAELLEI